MRFEKREGREEKDKSIKIKDRSSEGTVFYLLS
jgi:hypothetical protein